MLFVVLCLSCQPPQETRVAREEPRGEPSSDGPVETVEVRRTPSTWHLGVYRRDALPQVPVSIMTLLARPSDFEGRRVSAAGFFIFGFEERKLCFSEEVFRHNPIGNCLWLEFDWEALKSDQFPDEAALYKELDEWSQRYVVVVGTFRGDPQGHLGTSDGAIGSNRSHATDRGART